MEAGINLEKREKGRAEKHGLKHVHVGKHPAVFFH